METVACLATFQEAFGSADFFTKSGSKVSDKKKKMARTRAPSASMPEIPLALKNAKVGC